MLMDDKKIMDDKKETPRLTVRTRGLIWQLVIGTLAGAGTVLGLKVGWQKLIGWAKGVKPEYVIGNTALCGAIGGSVAAVIDYEIVSNRDKDPPGVNELVGDKSHKQQVVDRRLQKSTGSMSRS
jgi:hypothetical protein